jgi:hypothetical protein
VSEPLLEKIDTSECPARFRFVWDLYVKAWQQQGNDVNAKVGHNIAVAGEAIVMQNPTPLFRLGSATANDITTAPFIECQRVAADYGYYSPDIPLPELAKMRGRTQ